MLRHLGGPPDVEGGRVEGRRVEGRRAERPVSVDGALDFTVDGPRGRTGGSVVGDGPVLRVRADDPVAAWDAAVGGAPRGPGSLGSLADLLSEHGLSVEVSGPDGRLATVGAGVDSALGRAVTGSRRVRPGRPAALRTLVVAQLRQGAVARRRPLVVALAAAAALLLRRRSRPGQGRRH